MPWMKDPDKECDEKIKKIADSQAVSRY